MQTLTPVQMETLQAIGIDTEDLIVVMLPALPAGHCGCPPYHGTFYELQRLSAPLGSRSPDRV